MNARKRAVELLLMNDLNVLLVMCQSKVVGEESVRFSTLIIEVIKQVDISILENFLTKAIREKIALHCKNFG
jgi:hypothetical protein